MKEILPSNEIVQKNKVFTEIDEKEREKTFKIIEKEKEESKKDQKQKAESLLEKLYDTNKYSDKELLENIFPHISEEEKEEFSQFRNMSLSDFDDYGSMVGRRQYESSGNHVKSAKAILRYISHQKEDSNKEQANKDLLCRHAAQHLERGGNTKGAIRILEHIKEDHPSLGKEYFDATLAFFKHDYEAIKIINNNRKRNPGDDLDNFIGDTLEAMEILGKEGDRDYGKAYGGL